MHTVGLPQAFEKKSFIKYKINFAVLTASDS